MTIYQENLAATKRDMAENPAKYDYSDGPDKPMSAALAAQFEANRPLWLKDRLAKKAK